jgi:hypothetical protein
MTSSKKSGVGADPAAAAELDGADRGLLAGLVVQRTEALDLGLMGYVEERRKLDKPLFYDPARSRGGQAANPHYKKVGQRIAEWVGDLGVDGAVAPNHGWRHRWQSIARHVRMHQQIANFLVGHGDKDVTSVYGEKWTKTLYKEIMLIPRYEIPALLKVSTPHRRRARRVTDIGTA